MKLVFIGGGNMATAIIGGVIRQGTVAAEVGVVEPRTDARENLSAQFPGLRVFPETGADATAAEIIVLAVKPQVMRAVCSALAPFLGGQLVVSIAAGLRLADLSRWLGGYQSIVRTMPNTPALIGAGITGLFATPAISDPQRARVAAVLGAVGSTFWASDEAQMDAVTAVSGSGPAYVFHFLEALQAAAEAAGFDATTARQLAVDTTVGAARLAQSGADPLSLLRERVTSKGGTTEAALQVLTERAFVPSLVAAVKAAEERGRALGEQLGRDN
jgi:pyrroline-5-carboxylate reductase